MSAPSVSDLLARLDQLSEYELRLLLVYVTGSDRQRMLEALDWHGTAFSARPEAVTD